MLFLITHPKFIYYDGVFQKEAEFQQASLDASHAAKNLEEEIEKFEKKKLQDVKVWFVILFVVIRANCFHQYKTCTFIHIKIFPCA